MWKITRFDTLDSTNTYVKKHYDVLDNYSVITARVQTAGRGRLERKFISDDGGLYFSLLLKDTHLQYLANLTQLMALSVCKTLQEMGADAFIKWPNDVYADGKKICGMLSEAVADLHGPQALIIGVGVNVLQENLDVGQPAVSLKMLGIHAKPQEVLEKILTLFFKEYHAVLEHGFTTIRNAYLERFPYIGKTVEIKNGVINTRGTVETISPEGTLVLQTPQGRTEISIGDMNA